MSALHLTALRRAGQGISVFLLLYIIWKTRYPLAEFISPELYFKIDPFAMFITSIAERILLPGLIFSIVALALTLLFGRAFCGWICPLGALLDFVSFITSLITRPFPKKKKEREPLTLRHVKYGLLAVILILALAGLQVAWFFDPITIFVRTASFTLHPAFNAAIDGAMTRLLRTSDYPFWIESLYDRMRESFLSITTPEFNHTGVILIVFAIILTLTLVTRRFWCRYLCPLGATLALPSRFSLLRRTTDLCLRSCGICKNLCRMNAIREDNSYIQSECILCLDCMDGCPGRKSTFSFRGKRGNPFPHTLSNGSEQPIGVRAIHRGQSNDTGNGPSLTRGRFLLLGITTLFAGLRTALAGPLPRKRIRSGTAANLRPPGSLPEGEFVQRCIRCGNCMKICPTNVLQPASFQSGLAGAWAPQLDTSHGYCEYQCNLCGMVCPTDAISELAVEDKKRVQIGLALFDKKICTPYAEGINCIVCEEHCPIPDKAIRLVDATVKGKRVKQPVVIPGLCIGCAICENKCPTEPDKGVYMVRVSKI